MVIDGRRWDSSTSGKKHGPKKEENRGRGDALRAREALRSGQCCACMPNKMLCAGHHRIAGMSIQSPGQGDGALPVYRLLTMEWLSWDLQSSVSPLENELKSR